MAQKIVPGGTAARAIAGRSPQELPAQRQRAACNDLRQLGHPAMVEARWEGTAGHTLPDNRPGSWEAHSRQSLTRNVLNQGGRGRSRVLMANSSCKAGWAGG